MLNFRMMLMDLPNPARDTSLAGKRMCKNVPSLNIIYSASCSSLGRTLSGRCSARAEIHDSQLTGCYLCYDSR